MDDPRWSNIRPNMQHFQLFHLTFRQMTPGICLWTATESSSGKVYRLRYEDHRWNAILIKNGKAVCYCLPPYPDTPKEALQRILDWEREKVVQGVATPK